jgi:hypothetical protein
LLEVGFKLSVKATEQEFIQIVRCAAFRRSPGPGSTLFFKRLFRV